MTTRAPIDSSRALILAAVGFIYFYFAVSLRWLLSGVPILSGLMLGWILDSHYLQGSPRLLIGLFVFVNVSYMISTSSYILYPMFSVLCWSSSLGIALWRSQTLRLRLQPILTRWNQYKRDLERKIGSYRWPVLDFDGKGMLILGSSSLDLNTMAFRIGEIDLSFDVDKNTRILAKLDAIDIRLGRDIKVGELYFNIKGDGTPASELRSFSTPVSRDGSSISVTSTRSSVEEIRDDGSSKLASTRKLPPLPPTKAAGTDVNGDIRPIAVAPPALPPRLPPRDDVKPSIDDDVTYIAHTAENETEQEHIRQAIQASISEASGQGTRQEPSSPPASTKSNPSPQTPRDSRADAPDTPRSSIGEDDGSLFFPESDEIDGEFSRAALDEAAIHHSSETANPKPNDYDLKAAVAASLEAQISHRRSTEPQIKLSEVLARIPWWLKITPGALVTRLILSVLAWTHPITINSVAATSTGKRLTNLLETNGLKKAHPNQEIFRLIRKVFLWLEAGDLSLILSTITIQPHIPMAADNDINIVIKALQPTAYRNTNGVDEVLAKIEGVKGSFKIPIFLLPNHEAYIPSTPRSTIPASILLSLPGVFNRELLTIGAAFVKATTMMDLRQTAQNRPAPTMPLTSSGGQFSFKTFGLAVKQAAGDLAKQKGVQWGVRDAELAKWTAKFARLMGLVKVDVGGAFDIPVDLIKLRRKASIRELKKQAKVDT